MYLIQHTGHVEDRIAFDIHEDAKQFNLVWFRPDLSGIYRLFRL